MNKPLNITLTYWHIIYFFVASLVVATVWTEKVNNQMKELPPRVTIAEEKLSKQETSLTRIETSLSYLQSSTAQTQKDVSDIRNYILNSKGVK